jgi:hypothetical protein
LGGNFTFFALAQRQSDAEHCRAACHASVSANKAFQVTDGIFDPSRLRGLGLNLPTRPVVLQAEPRSAGAEHVEVVSLLQLQDDVKTSSFVPSNHQEKNL